MTDKLLSILLKSAVIIIITLLIFCAVIFSCAIIYMISSLFWNNEAIIGGVIGAVGAVAGGSLTLVGVQMTLEKQKQEKFIESFPKKLIEIDGILDILSMLINANHYKWLFVGNSPSQEIRSNISDLTIRASKVDSATYQKIKELEDSIIKINIISKQARYNLYHHESEDSITTETISNRETLVNEFIDMINKIGEEIKIHRKQMVSLFDQFTKV